MFKEQAAKEATASERAASEEMRLQKIISRAGIASRRHAEQLILTGQVTVNGKMVTELGSKAVPGRDHIKVGGKLLHEPAELTYLALHKPDAVVSTLLDPEGRPSLTDLLERAPERVYPIGRLPFHSSGLLLLTNDGELVNQLLHSTKIMQTWWVKVKGELTREEIEELDQRIGVKLTRMRSGDNAWYEAVLRNIRDDTLRPALAESGHPMEKLKRVRVGMIELGAMPVGAWRELNQQEISELRRMAGNGAKGMSAKSSMKLMPGKDEGVSRDSRKAILGQAAAIVENTRKPRPQQAGAKPGIRKPWLARATKPAHGGAKPWQGRLGAGARNSQPGRKPWHGKNAGGPQGGRPFSDRPRDDRNDSRGNTSAPAKGPGKPWRGKSSGVGQVAGPWRGNAPGAPRAGGNQRPPNQWKSSSGRPLKGGRKEWPRKSVGASQGGHPYGERNQWRGNNAGAADGPRKQWPKKNKSIPPGGRAWPEPAAPGGAPSAHPPWRGKRDNRPGGGAPGAGPAQAFRKFHPTSERADQPVGKNNDERNQGARGQSAPIYDRVNRPRATQQRNAGSPGAGTPEPRAASGKESHDE
jgi:23S rRNA pseudouridine2605 synthase